MLVLFLWSHTLSERETCNSVFCLINVIFFLWPKVDVSDNK